VLSARVAGQAIAAAERPPRVWLQMSSATIYAHRFDAANDEATGEIGGAEPGVPGYWGFSVDIARKWECEQEAADTPRTRLSTRPRSRRSPPPPPIAGYRSTRWVPVWCRRARPDPFAYWDGFNKLTVEHLA